jgi:hypothetical protein
VNKILAVILVIGAASLASAADAQTSTPGNVNDCTLIRDPVELRNCILRFEGDRSAPPAIIQAQPSGPAASSGDVPAAADALAPASGTRASTPPASASAQSSKAASPRRAAPHAQDTPVFIEQIDTPRSRR